MALISALLGQPFRRQLLGDDAVAEHEDAGAQREQVALVGGGDDHGEAVAARSAMIS